MNAYNFLSRTLAAGLALSLTVMLEAKPMPADSEVGPAAMPQQIAPIEAPFELGTIARPTFPNRTVVAKMSSKGLSTRSLQKAIDRLAARGGGRVVVPAGKWTVGRIELRSNIDLHLSAGATLLFSGSIADYQPAVFTRDEGVECYSLGAMIYACDAQNIAVTGQGTIECPSTDCEIYKANESNSANIEAMPLEERVFTGIGGGMVYLPKTIAPIRCSNVLIEGITISNGLYWNVVPQYCDNVIIRGVTVSSYGHGRTDGIDVESCSNVLIEYCSLDCGDDCYTLKSGRGQDGLRVGRPTENVVIRYSVALRGAGAITCGTETAGGINNVYLHDCVFSGTSRAFRFKTRRPRGGEVRNVTIERVRATGIVHEAFAVDMLGSRRWVGELANRYPQREINSLTPYFHNFTMRDVVVDSCDTFVSAAGLPERPLSNIELSNWKVKCRHWGSIQDVKNMQLSNVVVDDMPGTDASLTAATGK